MSQADEMLRDVWLVHGGRLVGDGVPPADVTEAETVLHSWNGWFDHWAGKAKRYEQLADEAVREGRLLSGGMLYWYGSMAYHYAQFLWFAAPDRREEGQRQKVRLYDLAAPLLAPPAMRFSVPADGLQVPVILRLPPGPGPHPCVVLLGGLESTKEESMLFENLCLERGLATCTFDGPGQGEFYFQARLRPDFERFTSAVVDFLELRPDVDNSRIGILGRSLGGYYAVRSAALDHRFKACVAWGALFDLSHFERMHSATKAGFAYVAGYDSAESAAGYLKESINLAGVAERLKCPLYVLHGAKDHLMPMEQVVRLREATAGVADAVWDVPEDGNHCCHNLAHIVRPKMADWLALKLGGSLGALGR